MSEVLAGLAGLGVGLLAGWFACRMTISRNALPELAKAARKQIERRRIETEVDRAKAQEEITRKIIERELELNSEAPDMTAKELRELQSRIDVLRTEHVMLDHP